MVKFRLFTPGPTMVPEEVLLEMARPIEHHRTSEFRALTGEVLTGLKYLFQTEQLPLIMATSGTGAMEGAIVSTCKPGRKALVARGGKFGERWAEVCEAFGIECVCLDVEWGCGAKADAVKKHLDQDPGIGYVILTHSETSTAAVSDLEGIAAVTRKRDVLLLVDAITSAGAIPLKTDAWGVDVVVTGSQKALMLPPGLGFSAVSARAWERIESFKSPTYYVDYRAYRKAMTDQDSPYTPAVSLIRGAHRSLQMIRAEGLENIWKRTAALARGTRAGAEAMGMKAFAKDPVDSVTALVVPEGVNEAALRKTLGKEYGCHVAGGQGKLSGKIIRISHMGYVDAVDTLGVIAALEHALKRMGHRVELGAGVTAFQKAYYAA
jgi:aspartate aminotransferase-like enzyme